MRSMILFHSLICSKLFVMLFIPSSVVKTGSLGIFAASLELVKDGAVQMLQKELFKEILIKKKS